MEDVVWEIENVIEELEEEEWERVMLVGLMVVGLRKSEDESVDGGAVSEG